MSQGETSPAVRSLLHEGNASARFTSFPFSRAAETVSERRSFTVWLLLSASSIALGATLDSFPLLALIILLMGTLRLVPQPHRRVGEWLWNDLRALAEDLPPSLRPSADERACADIPGSILTALKSSLDSSTVEWKRFLSSPEGEGWHERLLAVFRELEDQPPDLWDQLPLGDCDLKPWLALLFDERARLLDVAACDGRDPLPVDVLHNMSAHRAARLRSMAMEDLARHSCSASLDLILALLVESSDLHVRRSAAAMLAARNDANIEEVIAIALVDEDPMVRAHAVRALRGRRESAKLVFLLEGALLDSESVRQQAIEALAACSSDRAMSLLARALEDDASSVRRSAMIGLARHEQGRVLRYLNDDQLSVYRAMKNDLFRQTDYDGQPARPES